MNLYHHIAFGLLAIFATADLLGMLHSQIDWTARACFHAGTGGGRDLPHGPGNA